MNEKIVYKLIRSSRRTISIEINAEAEVLVRAPYRQSVSEIDRFVLSKKDWIRKHQEKMLERKQIREEIKQAEPEMTPEERAETLTELGKRAMQIFPERVRYFAPLVGVTYGRITIRNQKTRFGSCSAKGNLNFNCLLLRAPEDVRDKVVDYVVVHELCHRKQMNHSALFWAEVGRVMPDYRERRAWLREHGHELMMD